MRIYNTMSRKKEEFKPLTKGRVNIYVCGPTVYDDAHLGHARSYINLDIIIRYMRYLGYDVLYVQNITDVGHLIGNADSGEDKIIKRAQERKMQPLQLAEFYTRRYFEDMDALNIQRPDIAPRASGHIIEQIELIKTLLNKGYAYQVNGSVYFSVKKFANYGKLSGRNLEEQKKGARIKIAPEKQSSFDFALWKKAEPSHILQWPSPWGMGYPGWHIECSAMSMKYLGETLDIHAGGADNIFPHHENEIAQSEAATGKQFVRYWIHNGSLMVKNKKMSKSLGNFITIRQALKKHTPEQLRFFMLSTHYRKPLNYTEKAINNSSQGLDRLCQVMRNLKIKMFKAQPGSLDKKILAETEKYKNSFLACMNDDFNTAKAIGVLFQFAKSINSYLDNHSKASQKTLKKINKTFSDLAGNILGIMPESLKTKTETKSANKNLINLLISIRQEIRTAKNWQLGDKIRQALADYGVVLKDDKIRVI
ncbi:MAG: cysteine--tRNA ligase [bacterium]